MENLKDFWNRYKGAIIGVLLAILILATKLYKLFIVLILIGVFAVTGNYIQNNKEIVKDRLKNFIDRF